MMTTLLVSTIAVLAIVIWTRVEMKRMEAKFLQITSAVLIEIQQQTLIASKKLEHENHHLALGQQSAFKIDDILTLVRKNDISLMSPLQSAEVAAQFANDVTVVEKLDGTINVVAVEDDISNN
jgi:hypothetical protein